METIKFETDSEGNKFFIDSTGRRSSETMTNSNEAKATKDYETSYGHRSFSSAWSIFDLSGKKGIGHVWRIMNEDYKLVEQGEWLSFEKVTTKNEVSNG